ncbi:hypothetical protein CCY99_05400 [Helicobacter sp. 16-1353]|uniref:response regulator n=1 Tax=Helicobacter sp. 16-1353 TaxID=2004996 RepID=UPI000DCF46A6|nr:response regulator [Helicobacter sp. 16-1353]RAX53819.1 hypothetical protein CCY99_05400 [Helicobacter sp. 16-1353]
MGNNFLNLLNNISVLIVEDDEVALFGLKQALLPYCKNVFEAQDGLSAFEIYRKNSNNIDIVVTDINLPELNAFEMLERIIKINPNQKTIIMTSYPTDSNLQHSFKINNVCLFLRKPINIPDLQTHLAILAKKPQDDIIIQLSDRIYVNKTKKEIFLDNKPLILNGLGNNFFWLLINNINRVMSYDILQDYLYGEKESSVYNLRMVVVRLKNQLQDKNIIINIQDEGYMIKSIN